MQEYASTPTILYIMGAGRSGSTVLSIILGTHPKIEAVGEIKAWHRYKGLPRDHIDKRNYQFWHNVLNCYVYLKGANPNFEQLNVICNQIEAHNKLLWHLFHKLPFAIVNDYYEHINFLISSIKTISKKDIILDSSKNICRALFLLTFLSNKVKVIHLIRDPRGTLWSFMKKNVEQKSKKPIKAIIDYIAINSAASLIRYLFKKHVIKVRYEDIEKNPGKAISNIADFVGLTPMHLIERLNSKDVFEIKYLIDGNRVRKNHTIKFHADEEWKSKLPIIHKMLCSLIACPIYYL